MRETVKVSGLDQVFLGLLVVAATSFICGLIFGHSILFLSRLFS